MAKGYQWQLTATVVLTACTLVCFTAVAYFLKAYPPANGSEVASWVQGFGTILALFVSIGVGWYGAAAARAQQRIEWNRRRLEAAEGSLARLQVVRSMIRSAYSGLDECAKAAIPTQGWTAETVERCVDLIMGEIQSAVNAGSPEDWAELLRRAVSLRDLAELWRAPAVVRGGTQYEKTRAAFFKQLDTMVVLLSREVDDRARVLS